MTRRRPDDVVSTPGEWRIQVYGSLAATAVTLLILAIGVAAYLWRWL